MRFVLYTEKTVAQCMSALSERLQARPTATRPALDGWIEKKGRFSLALTAPVIWRFQRRTRLEATVQRESGITIVRGQVSEGANPTGQAIVLAAVALVSVMILLQGEILLALMVGLAGSVVYVPLRGDYQNSDQLLIEVERTLKANPKAPKKYRDKLAKK